MVDRLISPNSKYSKFLASPVWQDTPGRRYGYSDREVIEAYLGKDLNVRPDTLIANDDAPKATTVFGEVPSLDKILPMEEIEQYKLYEKNQKLLDEKYQLKTPGKDMSPEVRRFYENEELNKQAGGEHGTEYYKVNKDGSLEHKRIREIQLNKRKEWIDRLREQKLNEMTPEER